MAWAWLVFSWEKKYFLCGSSFWRQVLVQVPLGELGILESLDVLE